MILLGTLRYGDADTLKYATVKESLVRERKVCDGKTKLRFVASDAISFSSSLIWLLSAGETQELLFISNHISLTTQKFRCVHMRGSAGQSVTEMNIFPCEHASPGKRDETFRQNSLA